MSSSLSAKMTMSSAYSMLLIFMCWILTPLPVLSRFSGTSAMSSAKSRGEGDSLGGAPCYMGSILLTLSLSLFSSVGSYRVLV